MIQKNNIEDTGIKRFRIIFAIGTLLSIGLPILIKYTTSVPVIGLIGIGVGTFLLSIAASFIDYKNNDKDINDRDLKSSNKNNINLNKISEKENFISFTKDISKQSPQINTNYKNLISLQNKKTTLNSFQRR